MLNSHLTREQLWRELENAKQRIVELEAACEKYKRLEETAQRYHNLFEHSGNLVLVVDLATNRITEANTSAVRRLGYTKDELTQLALSDVEAPLFPNVVGDDYSWHSSFSDTTVYECNYRCKNGALIPVEVSSRLIRIGGRDLVQSVARNISKRKQIEAEREQLAADLDTFTHIVAHDLKECNAVIARLSETLARQLPELSACDAAKYLETIAEQSFKIGSIVDRLLSGRNAEAG